MLYVPPLSVAARLSELAAMLSCFELSGSIWQATIMDKRCILPDKLVTSKCNALYLLRQGLMTMMTISVMLVGNSSRCPYLELHYTSRQYITAGDPL